MQFRVPRAREEEILIRITIKDSRYLTITPSRSSGLGCRHSRRPPLSPVSAVATERAALWGLFSLAAYRPSLLSTTREGPGDYIGKEHPSDLRSAKLFAAAIKTFHGRHKRFPVSNKKPRLINSSAPSASEKPTRRTKVDGEEPPRRSPFPPTGEEFRGVYNAPFISARIGPRLDSANIFEPR